MIPVYVANLPSRTDRKIHTEIQFKQRNEFALTIFPAVKHNVGAYGIWLTIQAIIKQYGANAEYIVFCEDDHQFTNAYNFDSLNRYIHEAQKLNADVLLGGVSWFETAIQVSPNLFWIETFSGLQFTIIFSKFYKKILKASYDLSKATDYMISQLTDKIFVIHPFISTQYESGYSDVTFTNAKSGFVSGLFESSSKQFELIEKINRHYKIF